MIKNAPYPYYEHKDIHNLKELMDLDLERDANRIAFSFRNKEKELINKTSNDFYYDVTYLSNYLSNEYKNKHIALIGENSYEWIVYFFAIILSGNVAVAIDKDMDEDHIHTLLKQSDTDIAFYSESYCKFTKLPHTKTYPLSEINTYINNGKNLKNKAKVKDDDLAVIFFTSGTTGPNKGVMLSSRNISSDIYAASSIFKPEKGALSVLPYHHAFGLITSVLKPYYYGVNIFITSSLKNILKDLETSKPDTLFVVPLFVETFYKQIWSTARKTKKDKALKALIKMSNGLLKIGIDKRRTLFKSVLSSFGGEVKYIICGGAYLDPKYVRWFRSIGIEILNGYGITECSPVISVNRNEFYRDGSVGQVVRGGEIKIIDEEVCFKGDNVMLGYYKDKKATESVIIDGYFHTGDLGYIDDDGFLFLTGRKKNLIILSNGENISPEVIEAYFLHDAAVCETVVYAKDGMIIAEIYPNEEYFGDQEYFDNLMKLYNENKPRDHQVALVKLRSEEFPKNTNKKILRNKVMEENK